MLGGDSTSLNVRIDGDVDPYEREIRKAQAATRAYERDLESLNRNIALLDKQLADDTAKRLEARNRAFTATGRGMVIAGAAMAVGAGYAVKAAMDWESSWRDVQKVVTGTPEQMGALEQQLRDMAKVLPASQSEIAATAAAAGQLGVQRDNIASFTKTMIMMGTATNLSSDEAATSIARFMNVMRSAGDEVDNIGSTIVALGNKGASTESEITAMAQRVAGAGSLIGASQQDVLGLAAAMANLGIQSELGGGAMQRVLTIIYSKMKAGGSAVKDLADVAGVSAEEFARKWEADPVKAFDIFLQGLNQVKASGGDVVATLASLGITGTQNLQVLLRLAGAGDMLTKSLATANKSWDQNNALTNEANARYQTAAARLEIARNNLNDVAITIGASLLPAFVSILNAVSNLARGFQMLPGPVKAIIGPATALMAAITLLGGAALLAIPKIAAFNAVIAEESAGPRLTSMGKGIQGVAGALAGPWGLALGAGVTALTIFMQKQGEAAQKVEELKQTLDEQTGVVTENTRAWVVQQLSKDGTLQQAQALGFSVKTVTDAALGQTAALEQLHTQVAGLNDTQLPDWMTQTNALGAGPDPALLQDETGRAAVALDAKLSHTNDTLTEAQQKWQLEHEAMGTATDGAKENASASDAAAQAQQGLGSDTATTTMKMDQEAASAKGLMNALDKLNDAVLGQRSGARDYQQTLDDARATLQKGTRTLDINTKAGRDNQAALDSIAESTLRWADAAAKTDKSGQQSFEIMQQGRKDLIATARQFGMTAEQARGLADRILDIPKKWETAFSVSDKATNPVQDLHRDIEQVPTHHITQFDVNTQAARGEVAGFVAAANASLANIHDQTIDLVLSRHRVGPAMARGGRVVGPGGPTEDRVPIRASAGEHVWTASEVRAAGGHTAVESLRREVLSRGQRALSAEVAVVGRVPAGTPDTGRRGGGSGPMSIAGTLTIPGFGEGYIRGIVQDEMTDEASYADALAGRGR